MPRGYYRRSHRRSDGVRPLDGPGAHPYLVVFRELQRALAEAPASERETRQARALAQLRRERGARFADVIDWALREHATDLATRRVG